MAREEWRSRGGYDLDQEPDQLEVIDEGYGKYRRPDAVDSDEEARLKKTAQRRFALTITILVIIAGAALYLGSRRGDFSAQRQLASIEQLDQATFLFALTDTAAVRDIRSRFSGIGLQLPFVEGVVARYLFLRHPVEIWVGTAPLQESAAEALSLLIEHTEQARSPSWETQSESIRSGRMVYEHTRRGQRHYFYRDSNMIVWVTSDTLAAPFALEAVLNTNLRTWLTTLP
jgi:hypothetical protein